jgi:hypothetical protein
MQETDVYETSSMASTWTSLATQQDCCHVLEDADPPANPKLADESNVHGERRKIHASLDPVYT